MHLWYTIRLILPLTIVFTRMEPIPMDLTTLSSSKYILYELITLYISIVPIWSNVHGGCWIHIPFGHTLGLCLLCITNASSPSFFCISCIFTFIVICFVAKTCNVTQFTAIEVRPCALIRKLIVRFALSQRHGNILTLGLFSLHFDILYIIRTVT